MYVAKAPINQHPNEKAASDASPGGFFLTLAADHLS